MYLLYNLVLTLGSLLVLPFYLFKIVVTGKYRRSFLHRLGFLPKGLVDDLCGENIVWLHAVSVGEVLSALSLIRRIKEENPDVRILVSTVTETGNHMAKSRLADVDAVIFFPLDFTWVVKRVIRAICPRLFILVETDIWPNFLRELGKHNVPCIIINGRVSPRSYRRYMRFKWFFRAVLGNISIFSMQSEVDCYRIIESGADRSRVVTTGNLKFDQQIPGLTEVEKESILSSMGLKAASKVFVAGSTHRGEEEIVLDVFTELRREHPDLVLILAPRNPERFVEVEDVLFKRDFIWIRRTRGNASSDWGSVEVILLDTMGELSEIYSIGLLVFVGGSFVRVGGHNLLEPAAHKKAVMFGPHMHNFLEISGVLKDSGGGIQLKDKDEFLFHARRLLNDSSLLRNLGEAAYSVIERNRGATLRNMEIINRFI